MTSAASILRQGVKSLAELGESPVKKRKWVWDQLIPEAKPVLLGGPPGAGKSYLAQTICMAASEGLELYGYQTNSRPTLYLTCEDDTAELNRRSLTIARGSVDRLQLYAVLYRESRGVRAPPFVAKMGR